MFGFIKKILITSIAFAGLNGYNVVNAITLKCVLWVIKSVE